MMQNLIPVLKNTPPQFVQMFFRRTPLRVVYEYQLFEISMHI